MKKFKDRGRKVLGKATDDIPQGGETHADILSPEDKLIYQAFGTALGLIQATPWFACSAVALAKGGRPVAIWELNDQKGGFVEEELIEPALAVGAQAVVLVHHIPDVHWSPSPKDMEATVEAEAALEAHGIVLLDRIFITTSGTLDFRCRDFLASVAARKEA